MHVGPFHHRCRDGPPLLSGEAREAAMTNFSGEGPLSLAALDSSPEGGAEGRRDYGLPLPVGEVSRLNRDGEGVARMMRL